MKKKIKFFKGFSVTDIAIWSASVILIIASQFIFGGGSTFALAASLVGSTSLIFNARGNPFGQVLIICFMYYVRYHFVYLRILRRDDNISRNDSADGGICPYIVDPKSVQRR